jgi:hypothetical protein
MAGLTLEALLGGLARRGSPLASESALFLALECAEALRERPRRLHVKNVTLDAEGQFDVQAAPAADEPEALRALGALVRALHDPMTSGARAFVGRVEDGSIDGIRSAVSELEAMLVPLNRAAARRVVARLVREVTRESPQVSGERSALRSELGDGATVSAAPAGDPSSVDTEPEGAVQGGDGATATVLTDTTPLPARLPAPPRLGSFATMPIGPSSGSSEPDTRPDAAADASTTALDQDVVLPVQAAVEEDSPRVRRRPERPSGGGGVVLAVVAAVLLGAVLFLLVQIGAR